MAYITEYQWNNLLKRPKRSFDLLATTHVQYYRWILCGWFLCGIIWLWKVCLFTDDTLTWASDISGKCWFPHSNGNFKKIIACRSHFIRIIREVFVCSMSIASKDPNYHQKTPKFIAFIWSMIPKSSNIRNFKHNSTENPQFNAIFTFFQKLK